MKTYDELIEFAENLADDSMVITLAIVPSKNGSEVYVARVQVDEQVQEVITTKGLKTSLVDAVSKITKCIDGENLQEKEGIKKGKVNLEGKNFDELITTLEKEGEII